MKTREQIAESLVERVGHIYFRPLMYGGNSGEVELLLSLYHSFWAELVNKEGELSASIKSVMEEQRCGAFSFVRRYKYTNPNSSEEEVADYAVLQWVKISRLVQLPIAYKTLREIYFPLRENGQGNKRLQLLFQESTL